ncbi:MAG: CidA/LrgA family protein [Cellulosilyticum sp.]|nr:CidA/LrgA family protein [Cellulosilyticum sp.]
MKYIKQFGIILSISFIGELLNNIIPFTVPASIYGLLIMLLALRFQIIRLEQVKDVATFLIEIMPIMFIPAAAGLITSWDTLKAILLPVMITTLCSTVIVMLITGQVTQGIIKHGKRD